MGNNNPNSTKNQNITNRGLIDTQRTDTATKYGDAINGFQNDRFVANQNSSGLRNSLMSTYGKSPGQFYSTGNDARTSMIDGQGGGGGYDAGNNPTGNNDLSSFMPSGMMPNQNGWFNLPNNGTGPAFASADFSKAKAGYGNLADTGNAADYADAKAGYDEFARTGGVDGTTLRRRGTAQIPAFYDAYKASSTRRANQQGGYSPGFDSQQAEMGRQAGREGFNAVRQVEGDIADKTQTGRMFGIGGQANIGDRISGNRITGLGGLTNIGGMEGDLSKFNAGSQNSWDAQNMGAQLDLAKMYQSGKQFSAGQLQNLYGQDRADAANANQNILSGLGNLSQNDINNLQLRLATNNSKGIDWAKWAKIAGGAGLAVGGAFAGPAAPALIGSGAGMIASA